MNTAKTWLRPITPLLMAVVSGCAPAYHSYSGCYVDCKYCAPPPLPYVHYEGCVCHSCAAAKYLTLPSVFVEPTDNSEDRDAQPE